MAKELKVFKGRYCFYCSGKPDEYGHGIYGVWILRDGRLIIHQTWKKMPNKQEANDMLDLFMKGDKK